MLADWLQGTHMYTLYTSYATTNASVSAGVLQGERGRGFREVHSSPLGFFFPPPPPPAARIAYSE